MIYDCLVPLVDKRVHGLQVKLCDLLFTRVIPERLRDEQLIIKIYTNKASFTSTFFSAKQEIGYEERLRNDLHVLCVEWDVKP